MDRRQAGPGADQGVLQGRHPDPGRCRAGHHHRHPPRGHPLPDAGQHRPQHPGRALHRGLAGLRPALDPQESHAQCPCDLASGPLRGRLCRAGQGDPRSRPGAVRAGRCGAGTDRASPVGGQDEDHPHRRGVRLPGLPHPAAAPARHEPAVRLHLPVEEGPCGHHRQGADLTHRTANRSLAVLLYRLNPVLRGWCAYFRYGVSSHSFGYLEAYAWRRILRWLRRRHPHSNWKTLRRAFLPGWLPTQDGVVMVRPSTVRVSRYRYRGHHIPTSWATATGPTAKPAAESLAKGSRVVVVGRLQQRSWTAEDGSARSTVEVLAEELGPSWRWAAATTTKTTRSQ